MSEDYCVVIGGANADIGGRPNAPLIPKDSNPGKIFISMGGVGRNIAHNMRLMDMEVRLITALGEDHNGQIIRENCQELGINIDGYVSSKEDSTSSYLFIADRDGDMSVAISDMGIYEKITPDYIATRMDEINHASLVVVDTNIPEETIEYLAANCKVPIYADPVSCTKASRLVTSLGRIHTITPNALEARVLTGVTINNEEDMKKAARILTDRGIKNVFITLGSEGVFAANAKETIHLPILEGKLVNATGGGDAMMAGFAYAGLYDYTLRETALIGLAAAAIAIEGEGTINEKMNIESVLNRAGL